MSYKSYLLCTLCLLRVTGLTIHAFFTSISSQDVNWHVRLDHPSNVVLNKLVKMAYINCKIFSSTLLCIVCPLVKSHKLYFRASTHKSIKSFDLIYVDLYISPILFVILAKYFLLVVDDNTKFM